jgi:hypothetical protein
METDYKKLWELERQERYAHHANATALLGFNEKLLSEKKSVAQEVALLEKQRDDAIELLGTILATVTIEGNKQHFAPLPEFWHTLVGQWVKDLQAIKAAEHCMHPTSGAGSVTAALSTGEISPSNQPVSVPSTCG